MSETRTRVALLVAFPLVALTAFVGTALADLSGPPSASPVVPPAPDARPVIQPQFVVSGRGAEAARALALAKADLPFAPLLPTHSLPSMELVQVEVRSTSPASALLDVLFMDPGGVQLHVFEANYPMDKPVLASVKETRDLPINGRTWRYVLLEYPQPAGASYFVHVVDRAFDGALYISIGLHSRGELVAEREALFAVASSLR